MRLYAVRARLTLYEGYLLTLRLQVDQGRVLLLAGLAEARACRDINVLIGHCVIATMEGCAGRFAEAFAELAEVERLMHIWDVPPIYYLAMVTLVKCELWLLQGRMDLAEAWLLRLTQAYNGEPGAAAPSVIRNCHNTSNCSVRCWIDCRVMMLPASNVCRRWSGIPGRWARHCSGLSR